MAGHEFVFDEGGDTGLETAMALTPRWRELPHAPERTRAFIMVPGERLATPWLTAETETSVWLQLARGLPEISDDGLEVGLWLERDGGEPQPLLTLFLDNQAPDAGKQGLSLPLPLREGEKFRVSLRCGPGPRGEPDAWNDCRCCARVATPAGDWPTSWPTSVAHMTRPSTPGARSIVAVMPPRVACGACPSRRRPCRRRIFRGCRHA